MKKTTSWLRPCPQWLPFQRLRKGYIQLQLEVGGRRATGWGCRQGFKYPAGPQRLPFQRLRKCYIRLQSQLTHLAVLQIKFTVSEYSVHHQFIMQRNNIGLQLHAFTNLTQSSDDATTISLTQTTDRRRNEFTVSHKQTESINMMVIQLIQLAKR